MYITEREREREREGEREGGEREREREREREGERERERERERDREREREREKCIHNTNAHAYKTIQQHCNHGNNKTMVFFTQTSKDTTWESCACDTGG